MTSLHTTSTTTSTSSRNRKRLAGLLLAGTTAAVLAGGASAAHASNVTAGPSQTIGTVPPVTCLPSACAKATSQRFAYAQGEAVSVLGIFPSGAAGTAHYKVTCPSGYSETKNLPISTVVNMAFLPAVPAGSKQTCTVTQTVTGFTTTTSHHVTPAGPGHPYKTNVIEFHNS